MTLAKWYQNFAELYKRKGFSEVIALLSVLLLFSMLSFISSDNTYSIERFQLSPETIRSSKTVEDTLKTEQDRQAAIDATDPVYAFQEEAAENQQAWIESVFESLIAAKQQELDEDSAESSLQMFRDELETLSMDLSNVLTDEDIETMIQQPLSALQTTVNLSSEEISTTLSEPLRSGQLTSVREQTVNDIRNRLPYSQSFEAAVAKIVRLAIIETEIMDEELTQQRREQAASQVEPTRILQGQLLVQKGQYVDREIYRQLELSGMISNQTSYIPFIGVGLLSFLAIGGLYGAYIISKGTKKTRIKQLAVTLLVLILAALLMVVTSLIDENFTFTIAFLFPTAFVAMTVYLLTTERHAYVAIISASLLSGYIFKEGFTSFLQTDIALYNLLGGLAGIFALKMISNNAHILKASAVVSFINVLFILAYLLLSSSTITMQDSFLFLGVALLSGMISGAFTLGTLPFFESAFSILSTMKLLELANPGHPLLKKLLMETPGTYHHSVMVANLSESACEAIGANGLLARVACYYHDIGKTRRPGFFIENQTNGYNPHDHLPPETSASIIKDHTTDGASILLHSRIPRPIIDVALQHHGTTCVKYFYYKAKKEDEEVEQDDFRYAGPKPQTREAAVISIADSVEAAVRSMQQPSSTKIQGLIDSIVSDRINDGQFDECEISMKDLVKVKESIYSTLQGFYHERIEYPKEGTK